MRFVIFKIGTQHLKYNFVVFLFLSQKLPRIPAVQHLSLQQNNIKTLTGIERLKDSQVQSIILRENPVSLTPDYRKE